MNWDALGAVGELIGGVTVIATLFYLSLQIRQNTIMQKAQTSWLISETRRDDVKVQLNSPELRVAFLKIREGEQLSSEEIQLVVLWSFNSVRALEAELKQHKMGMVDDDELEARLEGMRKNESFKPEWMGDLMSRFTPDTREVVAQIVRDRASGT